MAPRKRTHLVHELMHEAQLMMGVLEKAMQGERIEERHPPSTARIICRDRIAWRMSTNRGSRSSGH
jgi:hypothetical protein